MGKRKIEIMDTTLRDGEQTSGVSFSAAEKLTIAQLLLEELHIDRIEIASARVSEGEFQGVKGIMEWASAKGYTDKIEVLSFVDGGVSIEWMKKAGAKVQNLLTKGSLNHLTHQLKKTPEQHFNEIAQAIALAKRLRDDAYPNLSAQLSEFIAKVNFKPAGSVEDFGVYLKLFMGVRETHDRFVADVFDRPLTELIAATAPRKGVEKADRTKMSGVNRRRLKKLAKVVNGGATDDYNKMRMELNKRCVASGLIKDPSVQKGRGATAARPKRVGCVDAGGFRLEDVDELPTDIDVAAI